MLITSAMFSQWMISALSMDKTGSMTKYSNFFFFNYSYLVKSICVNTCIIPYLVCSFISLLISFQVMNMYGDLVMDSVPDKVMNNKITFPAI